MIYLLQRKEKTVHRMQHSNNEPFGVDDFNEFPISEDAGVEIGVVPALGGNIMFVPIREHEEDEIEAVTVNQPATSHYKWHHEEPITDEVALLATSIEDLQNDLREAMYEAARDGFIDAKWALKKVRKKKHEESCLMAGSHAGLTYILTGDEAGAYQVCKYTEGEDEE